MLAINKIKPLVAIIGAGPGGLLTAYYLERYGVGQLDIRIVEASGRVGGKIFTPHMPHTNFAYEAGVAEIYDYSQLGADPLKNLILDLGLAITPMDGEAVVFEGKLLGNEDEVRLHLGQEASERLDALARSARLAFSPESYYQSDWEQGLHDPATRDTFAKFLDEIGDERVRRYVETVVHSDLATQPHKTSAAYGLQNWLMNEPDYMQLYSINGGNEQFVSELAKRLTVPVHTKTQVTHVITRDDGRYDVLWSNAGVSSCETFDCVVMALPITNLSQLTFVGQSLDQAMRDHIRHYDHPAHYLRITVAFTSAFWRNAVTGSFFMIEAFGGACVYDESSRSATATDAILSWLLAGDAAMSLSNTSEADLLTAVLASLPEEIRPNNSQVIEAKVHRWVGAVNAWPMGSPIHEPDSRHMPDELGHPNIYVVGDYLFDSTVNGVMDSADTVAQLLLNINLDGQTHDDDHILARGDTLMTTTRRFIHYAPTPATEGTYLRQFQHPENECAYEISEPADAVAFDGLTLSIGVDDAAPKKPTPSIYPSCNPASQFTGGQVLQPLRQHPKRPSNLSQPCSILIICNVKRSASNLF